jgi:carbon storage regulator CsrA
VLALSRNVGERIIICTEEVLGRNIEVVVIGVQGHRVKLGFEAPRNIVIQREENLQDGKRPGKCRHCRTGEGSACECV